MVALRVVYRTRGGVLVAALPPVAMDLMTVSVKAFPNLLLPSLLPSENSSLLCEVPCEGENADAFSFQFLFFLFFLYICSRTGTGFSLDVQRATRKRKTSLRQTMCPERLISPNAIAA